MGTRDTSVGQVYRVQLGKIKRELCKYGNVMEDKYKFYILNSMFQTLVLISMLNL